MTYDQWFRSQQGTAYEGAYLFAEAAWDHQQKRIDELETQLAKNNPLLDEAADAIDKLTVERNELRAALQELTSTVGLAIDGATGWDAHRNARKLLTRVKGGAA